MIAEVERAIARALSFLERRQPPSGEVPVLISTHPDMAERCLVDPAVFPTAVAVHALANVPGAATVRERALDFLARQVDQDGMSRHWTPRHPQYDWMPPDLDDTSLVSAALARHGRPAPANHEIVLANRNRRGLFYTWVIPRPMFNRSLAYWAATLPQLKRARLIRLLFTKTPALPFDVDAVVNANVLFYLGATTGTRPVVEHLLSVLRTDRERACDKWYENPFAVWYFFSRALAPVAPEAGDLVAAKIVSATPASALDAALGACSLMYWKRSPREDAIRTLVHAQLESGGWPRAPLYHAGRTRLRGGWFAPTRPTAPRWGSEELTTALCLEALAGWSTLHGSH
jgi:hypothetical protein